MDRRRPPHHSDRGRAWHALALLFVAAVLVLGVGAAAPSQVAAAPPDDTPTTTALDNDFIPTERDLTDCIGVLQRPGCGSEARGGWRQTVVFLVVAAGLAVVFWRVRANVLRNRRSV